MYMEVNSLHLTQTYAWIFVSGQYLVSELRENECLLSFKYFFYNRRNLKAEENDGNEMCIVSRWAVFNIVIFAKMSKVHYLQTISILFAINRPWSVWRCSCFFSLGNNYCEVSLV